MKGSRGIRADVLGSVRAHAIWWCLTLSTLLAFWIEDLHRARFAYVLFVVPAAALLGRAVRLGASVGGMLGVLFVWVRMIERADNGCTGVSASFTRTLFLLGAMLIVGAPWVLARARRAQLPIAGLRR